MTIKAVIFDMDGVLIDAREWHFKCLNEALFCFGENISEEDHNNRFDGLPTKKKLEMLSEEGRIPTKLHNLINDLKQKFTIDYIHRECMPTYQHEYALSRLKNEGYKIALASNSVRGTVELMMQKSNLVQYLDLTLSASDVEKPKPDPEIYNTAIDRLGFSPSECMIIEDNENGIKSAIASKANVFEVRDVWDVTYSNLKNKIEEFNKK